MKPSHANQRHGVVRLPLFDAKPGLPPGGRSECKDGARPCPYVRCKWHLWLVLGEDRPGRPHGGKHPPTTLRPAWLETPIPPSCGADIADAIAAGKPMTMAELGRLVGLRESRLFHVLATALEKLGVSGESLREFTEADRRCV